MISKQQEETSRKVGVKILSRRLVIAEREFSHTISRHNILGLYRPVSSACQSTSAQSVGTKRGARMGEDSTREGLIVIININ